MGCLLICCIETLPVIPLEIEKQGPEIVKKYKKALRDGKDTIPRCGLLFLGQERKGKTSLYKLLVGKDFDPNQDSTLGIDNNEVSTVDPREVTIEWSEKSKGDQFKERENLHASAIIRVSEIKLPDQPKVGKRFQDRTEEDLLREIDRVIAKIAKLKIRESLLKSQQSHSVRPVESKSRRELYASRPLVSPMVSGEKSTPSLAIKPPAERPKPKPDIVPVPDRRLPNLAKPNPPSPPRSQYKAPLEDKKRNPSPPIPQLTSGSSLSDVKSISKALKEPKVRSSKPCLRLNVLDFAGQKNYRPMHHCFITRRAMYLVVFNLQDMRKYVLSLKQKGSTSNSSPSPIEEIRYWLHSIHAHIYPPDPKGKIIPDPCDQRHRRVILVGTHQNPDSGKSALSDSDLDMINDFFKEKVLKDRRCVDHLHISSTTNRCFVAVENSLRGEVSGGPSLQKDLAEVASKLDFLEDEYPISWLRLERKLMHMQDSSDFMCFTEERIISIAESKGVNSETLGPKDALEFFHDTGKIILLSEFQLY